MIDGLSGPAFDDSATLTVPPGEVTVRWMRREDDGSRRLDREERRTVVAGQELTFEWEPR